MTNSKLTFLSSFSPISSSEGEKNPNLTSSPTYNFYYNFTFKKADILIPFGTVLSVFINQTLEQKNGKW
jgi:hypothetical protein